jgi:diacylglycerol O-acyltransferase
MAESVAAADRVPLSREDRSILALESPTVAGHICFVAVIREGLVVDELRESVNERLESVPSLRRRLDAVDGDAIWVPDVAFDIRSHVVDGLESHTVSQSGIEWRVAQLFAQRLERSRPLWRIDVAGPLDDGSQAIVWRIHHALAVGMTAMQYATAILWDAPDRDVAPKVTSAKVTVPSEQAHREHRSSVGRRNVERCRAVMRRRRNTTLARRAPRQYRPVTGQSPC